jgi:hypothetical protein
VVLQHGHLVALREAPALWAAAPGLAVVESKKPRRDEIREERIDMEIVVDAYKEEERATGRYYYL